MLYRVEIENFFSISEPQVIDLRARKSVKDIFGRLSPIHAGSKWHGPNVVALYGPNAAGKSNVLRAINFGVWFVNYSFSYMHSILPYQKFGNWVQINAPTRLVFSFTGPMEFMHSLDTKRQCPYEYEIVLAPRQGIETNTDSVIRERLKYRPNGVGKAITIIDRQKDRNLRFVRGFMTSGHERALKAILRSNASVISTLAQLENKPAMNFVSLIKGIQTNITTDRIEGNEIEVAQWYAKNKTAFEQLCTIGRSIDLGIEQIDVDQSSSGPNLKFKHSGLDQIIYLHGESHGTRQFVKSFPLIQSALEYGSIVMIDDIDSAIHPLLLPEIIRWFGDDAKNPHKAQLWMTCHSPSTMSELTKEGILFCEKDAQGRSTVYRLADIEGVRRNENFFAKYMGGEYGAVPSLG